MFDVAPLIRPAIKDDDPNHEHAVWFLLDEVDGTFDDKTGVSKSVHWLKNHLEVTNADKELVIPIMVTREEYRAYFAPEAKEHPKGGVYAFLKERYEKQRPEPKTFGEAKQFTLHKGATYHPVAQGVSEQHYRPQKGQGDEAM